MLCNGKDGVCWSFSDGEWDSLSRLFSAEEELEFTPPHFLGQGSSFPNFQRNVVGMNFETPATFCTNNPEEAEMGLDRVNLFHPLDSHFQYLSCHIPVTNDISTTHDQKCFGPFGSFFTPALSESLMEGSVCGKQDSGSDRILGFSDASQPAAVAVPGKDTYFERCKNHLKF
ncbi:unnamed protein product [Prunus armeniaca]|uniref:Uncharacterized protein n=1 Tax=Prunus armeniaca TaxID=36596 RepID=A0A6J5W8N6_PRUAR|nr:unnamed protein product [Prunus armeniaca]